MDGSLISCVAFGFTRHFYAVVPYIAVMPSTTPPPAAKHGFLVALIVFSQALMVGCSTFTAPSQLILTNFTSPHPSVPARTNSISYLTTAMTARLVDGGTTVLTASNLPYIAKAVLACLESRPSRRDKYVYIGEFHVSQTDVLTAFEKVQGQKWTTENMDSETIIAAGQKKLEDGDKSGVKDLSRT
ncbi:hypothetical protein CSHISOI_09326 [Colletotrichum shisoi]|uniref:Uncharacterized protein n=1 Tax=Colletotrichum shisoi TaxID=2078593 RepID=A0A5Q4BHN3_9PEZI|nr:hypothetical protein CSHISOI_09326 [Colletotrichum shisoi]